MPNEPDQELSPYDRAAKRRREEGPRRDGPPFPPDRDKQPQEYAQYLAGWYAAEAEILGQVVGHCSGCGHLEATEYRRDQTYCARCAANLEEAYQAGRMDRRRGAREQDCPYQGDEFEEVEEWYVGWSDMDAIMTGKQE